MARITSALAPLAGGKLRRFRWEAEVGFRTAVMVWDGRLLWTAGSASGPDVDDYDWESLRGGGFAGLDPSDGRVVVSGPLPDDVAWGTGGVAVVALQGGLAAIGRTGRLHVIDPGQPDRVAFDGTAGVAIPRVGPRRRGWGPGCGWLQPGGLPPPSDGLAGGAGSSVAGRGTYSFMGS